MNTLIGFFALRPVFTMWGLRLAWLLFLAQQAVFIAGMYSSVGSISWRSLPAIITDLFHAGLYIVLVRLLIEVALVMLFRPPMPAQGEAR
jgi:hypothetical protein